MAWILNYLRSAVGLKQVMALTGLGLTLFLIVHMAGNYTILFGKDAFNRYSHGMFNSSIVWPARLGLFAALVFHVALAVLVTRRNTAARAQPYAVPLRRNGEGTAASKTMIITGLLILVYI